jgi:hypothetical protein
MMATTFYGPWYVVLSLADLDFAKRFVISGSENADGIYPVAFGNTLVLSVQGAKWQIEIQYISPFDPAGWEPAFVDESRKFVLGDGLVVQLDGSARIPVQDPPLFDPQLHLMRLICTSMDPEINPIPTANPFSFTLGEGPYSGGDDCYGQSDRRV